MKSEKPVIGIFGHYGNRNLGDESIIEASIQQVRCRLPEAEIRCFSLRPDDTAQRHQVPAYSVRYLASGREYLLPEETDTFSLPWKVYARQQQARSDEEDGSPDEIESRSAKGLKERLKAIPVLGSCLKFAIRVFHLLEGALNELRYLVRSYRYLKKFDLLIVAGSNQFLDNFDGPWGFPYTLMKWSIMAKLANVKLAYMSVGANPLASSLSKRMIHIALNRADYISYRDEASKFLIEGKRSQFDGAIFPDLAFGLKYSKINKARNDVKPSVGINPMPVYDYRYWCERDDGKYHDYVVKLARFSEHLITQGHPIFFFGTMWRDDDVIIDVINEIRPEIRGGLDDSKIIRESEQVEQLMGVLQEADIIMATRFHATVLPLLAGTPVLGISYYRKNVDLMNNMGQGAYHEELDSLDIDALWQKFETLCENLDVEQEKISENSNEYTKLVEQQWEQVISLI